MLEDQETLELLTGTMTRETPAMQMGRELAEPAGDLVEGTSISSTSATYGAAAFDLRSSGVMDLIVARQDGVVIYYAPTTEQLRNVGGAQEDSACLLAPEWQRIYEERANGIFRRL